MPRFYVPSSYFSTTEFTLPGNVARHVQVLRQQPEEHIELMDGRGVVYTAQITTMGKKDVAVRLIDQRRYSIESPLSITLLQSISSSERMDFTIQKSVELGVAAIQPVTTERSSQRPAGERADKKVGRWQDIAIAACEQCGRTVIPTVHAILPFQAALQAQATVPTKLIMSLNQPQALNHLAQPTSVAILIGPEGGLSAAEEMLAIQQYGFQAISLGPRVLRTETASLAVLAAMQMQWGDFAASR